MKKSDITLLFSILFLSVVLASGRNNENKISISGLLDLSKLTISCSSCHLIEDRLYEIAINASHLDDTKNALLDVTCRNGFFEPLPYVKDKCVQYISNLYLAIMDTVSYVKSKIQICEKVLTCDKILNLAELKVNIQAPVFVFLGKLSKRDSALTSTIQAIVLDTKDGLTTLVETLCEEAQKSTKTLTPGLLTRVDQECNFGSRPECSLCRLGTDLLDFYANGIINIITEKFHEFCEDDSQCATIFSRLLKIGDNLVQQVFQSDLICYQLGQCDQPPVFNLCSSLPEKAQKFCDVYVIATLPKQMNILKEHKLMPVTSQLACEYCKTTATNLQDFLVNNRADIYNKLQNLCHHIPLAKDVCLFFILKELNTTIDKVISLLNPDDLCPRFNLCLESKNVTTANNQYFCSRCNTVVVFVQSKLRGVLLESEIKQRASNICKKYIKSTFGCNFVIRKYFHTLYDLLTGKLMSNELCTRIPDCVAPPPKPFTN